MNPVDSARGPGHVGAGPFQYLQRLVRRHTGTVLEHGKEYLVEARLYALATGEGFGSVGALLEGLQLEDEDGSLHRRTAEAMLNYETSFFRDHYPFEVIREHLLPEILPRRASERTLSVWSAASSTGQEIYSVAMLLLEHFPELAGWDLRLLASDVSDSALERARAGVFGQVEVNRGLPAKLLVKYFERSGSQWGVREAVRGMVRFERINLAGPWPSLEPMDLVLLRNVLLYFRPEARGDVLRRVHRSLRPGGYLFLGGGETAPAPDLSFESVRTPKAVCYRARA
jgi:chemotaxis protein methyltransferase CheR